MPLAPQKTRRQQRARINHELMLEFPSTKQMDFSALLSYSHYSCIIHPRSQNGNFIGATTVASLSLNNDEQKLITGSATGTTLSNNGNEDYEVCNLVLYNRELTEVEISSLRRNGGYVPASAHEAVVAHYPLTQKTFFKADAAFTATHTQFSINDYVALDVSQIYNYAKPSGGILSVADAGGGDITITTDAAHGLSDGDIVNITNTTNYNGTYVISNASGTTFDVTDTFVITETGNWDNKNNPAHAELLNFTDAELGIDNASNATSIIDLYHKNPVKKLGFQFDDVKNGTMASATSISINTDWTATFKLSPIKRPYGSNQNRYVLWSGISASTVFVLRAKTEGGSSQVITFEFSWTEGAANLVRTIFSYADLDLATAGQITRRQLYITMRRSGTTVEYFVNGVKQSFSDSMNPDATTLQANTTWGSRNTGAEKIDSLAIIETEWHSVALEDHEIQDIHLGDLKIDTNLVFRHNWAADKITTVEDQTGTHDITMSAVTDNLIEFSGALPRIGEALFIETGKQVSTAYTSVYGLGLDIKTDASISAITEIITGLPAIDKYFVNGFEVSLSELIYQLNSNNVNHIDFIFSAALTGTINYVHTGVDYYVAGDYTFDQDSMTRIKSARKANNSLLSTFSAIRYINYYAWVPDEFVAGGSNPELNDFFGGAQKDFTGWTGGTPALQLTDLLTDIVTLDSLR